MIDRILKSLGLISKPVSDTYVVYDKARVDKYKQIYAGEVDISEIELPKIEGQTDFRIKKWFYSDGDFISKSQKLCTIESNSMTLDLESYQEGYIYFRQYPDMNLQDGQVICLLLSKSIMGDTPAPNTA